MPFQTDQMLCGFQGLIKLNLALNCQTRTKHFLQSEMARGCKKSELKIRVHDVRHSYALLLIELGFSPLLISERLAMKM